jgi:hypothetical protein
MSNKNPYEGKIKRFEFGPNGITNPLPRLKRVCRRELGDYVATGAMILRDYELKFLLDKFVGTDLDYYPEEEILRLQKDGITMKNEASYSLIHIPFPRDSTHCYIGTRRELQGPSAKEWDEGTYPGYFKAIPIIFLKERIP